MIFLFPQVGYVIVPWRVFSLKLTVCTQKWMAGILSPFLLGQTAYFQGRTVIVPWRVASLKLTVCTQKMDGWNTFSFPIGSNGLFSGTNCDRSLEGSLPETNSLHPKMDGWNTSLSYWVGFRPIFRDELLVIVPWRVFSLKLTVCTQKWMAGIQAFPIGLGFGLFSGTNC